MRDISIDVTKHYKVSVADKIVIISNFDGMCWRPRAQRYAGADALRLAHKEMHRLSRERQARMKNSAPGLAWGRLCGR